MARIKRRSISDVHFQARGWGREYWIENIQEYCGKILVVDPQKRGSLHFHKNKKETMLVQSGVLKLRLIDTDSGSEYFEVLHPGDSILIPPCQPHQIINDTHDELRIIEFSTFHEEEDSKRLQKGD